MWDILTDKVSGMFIMPEIKQKYSHTLNIKTPLEETVPVAMGGFDLDMATQGVEWDQLPAYVKNEIIASTRNNT